MGKAHEASNGNKKNYRQLKIGESWKNSVSQGSVHQLLLTGYPIPKSPENIQTGDTAQTVQVVCICI